MFLHFRLLFLFLPVYMASLFILFHYQLPVDLIFKLLHVGNNADEPLSARQFLQNADGAHPARLEAACAKALSYTPSPSLKNITTILQNGQDKVKNGTPPRTTGSYGLTRRAAREKGGVQA